VIRLVFRPARAWHDSDSDSVPAYDFTRSISPGRLPFAALEYFRYNPLCLRCTRAIRRLSHPSTGVGAASQADATSSESRRHRGPATGAIEVKVEELEVLNRCPPLPFEITEFSPDELASEDLRLQYRYLDLRRASLQRILMLRHRVCKVIRDYFDARGFLEVE